MNKVTRYNNVELRMSEPEEDKKSYYVSGYAALYDTPSDAAGWYTEVLQKGAFSDAVPRSDVRALINHDANLLLARTTSGTMEIKADDTGLYFSLSLPKTSYAEDLIESISRKDITQNSFAFTIDDEDWIDEKKGEKIKTTRVIKRVKELYDISLVTYPFYKETSFEMEKKSYEAYLERQRKADDRHEAKEYLKRLSLIQRRLSLQKHYL